MSSRHSAADRFMACLIKVAHWTVDTVHFVFEAPTCITTWMLESKLVESVNQKSRDAYANELVNMREVLANFKHRQKWCSKYFNRGKTHMCEDNFTDRYLFDDYGRDSCEQMETDNHKSINEMKRFIREMTELCSTMDRKKHEMDFFESCIQDMSNSNSEIGGDDENMLQCYVACRDNAMNYFNLAHVLAIIKFIESRQTTSLNGHMVENTVTTLYSMDDEKTRVNAWRDTVQGILAQGVEKLRQTEMELFRGQLNKASSTRKASSTSNSQAAASLSSDQQSLQSLQSPQSPQSPRPARLGQTMLVSPLA